MSEEKIFSIKGPDPQLLTYYFIKSLLTGPVFFLLFPALLIRYYTLRYNFDAQGISMRWGLIFVREVNLTYMRIQDINLTSNVIQRWMGLADIQIQTAAGSISPEMIIEGLTDYKDLRNYLYSKMRGYRDLAHPGEPKISPAPAAAENGDSRAVALLTEIASDIRAVRSAVEKLSPEKGA
jgi:putative membrane protein